MFFLWLVFSSCCVHSIQLKWFIDQPGSCYPEFTFAGREGSPALFELPDFALSLIAQMSWLPRPLTSLPLLISSLSPQIAAPNPVVLWAERGDKPASYLWALSWAGAGPPQAGDSLPSPRWSAVTQSAQGAVLSAWGEPGWAGLSPVLPREMCVLPSLLGVCRCSQQPALGIWREAEDCFKSFSKGIFEKFLAMENDLFLVALHLVTGE